jgi:FkbM family methyltransferase
VFERDDVARLPNGARMRFVSKPDVQFLYDEIFADECYAKHGLEIRPGATVIDVGGNIGMFALYAAEKAGAEGRVFALEPIPRTFAALRENVIRNVGFSSGRSLDATVDGEKEGKKEAARRPSATSRVACLDAKDATRHAKPSWRTTSASRTEKKKRRRLRFTPAPPGGPVWRRTTPRRAKT